MVCSVAALFFADGLSVTDRVLHDEVYARCAPVFLYLCMCICDAEYGPGSRAHTEANLGFQQQQAAPKRCHLHQVSNPACRCKNSNLKI